MLKYDPKTLALKIAQRSSHCIFCIGAVIHDSKGRIISWGWNIQNLGMDLKTFGHAEAHALRRANRTRLRGATIVVAGFTANSGKIITTRPCLKCVTLLHRFGIRQMQYTTKLHGHVISENIDDKPRRLPSICR